MTHSEIYKKFFIEYDKDMITSSYPSLTLVEVSNFLNKAYLALIALKFTGNNLRLTPFEGDTKQLEDLQPLIIRYMFNNTSAKKLSTNVVQFECPSNMLYYVDAYIMYTKNDNDVITDAENVLLISHEHTRKFMHTAYNRPWIESPVCTINNNLINIYYDDYKHTGILDFNFVLNYIKQPIMFNADNTKDVEFELNDSVIEELINLAITFVLDNVESSRILTKTNLLKLES